MRASTHLFQVEEDRGKDMSEYWKSTVRSIGDHGLVDLKGRRLIDIFSSPSIGVDIARSTYETARSNGLNMRRREDIKET